ncbi:MAG: hypothetical protein ACTSQ8_22555 [Candidatus Helarchaeota archaeon]
MGNLINNKERVTDLLDGKPIDKTPAYDLLRNDAAIEYYTGEKFTLFPPQGRWFIYGINLPDDVLKKIYSENVSRILGIK